MIDEVDRHSRQKEDEKNQILTISQDFRTLKLDAIHATHRGQRVDSLLNKYLKASRETCGRESNSGTPEYCPSSSHDG